MFSIFRDTFIMERLSKRLIRDLGKQRREVKDEDDDIYDIHSLEDIQKQKLRFEEKLNAEQKSISDHSDIARFIFNAQRGNISNGGETDSTLEIIESLLPTGINFIVMNIQINPDRRLLQRLIIYSIFGSVTALIVHKYLKYQKARSLQ